MRAWTSASFWNWDRSRASMVQVLEGGRQGAGHGQVPEHVAAPEQVERGPAGPGLAVAQRDGRQRRRDG